MQGSLENYVLKRKALLEALQLFLNHLTKAEVQVPELEETQEYPSKRYSTRTYGPKCKKTADLAQKLMAQVVQNQGLDIDITALIAVVKGLILTSREILGETDDLEWGENVVAVCERTGKGVIELVQVINAAYPGSTNSLLYRFC